MLDDRGQMQTIEGLSARTHYHRSVLVTIVQTSSVTPLSSLFTNQHIKLELKNVGNDILSSLDETNIYNSSDPSVPSLLKDSIVIVGDLRQLHPIYMEQHHIRINRYDTNITAKDTWLSNSLKFALIKNGTAFNVELRYPDGSRDTCKRSR